MVSNCLKEKEETEVQDELIEIMKYELWLLTILGKLSLPPQNEHKVLNRLGCSLHQNKAKDYDPTLKIVQSSSNKLYKTKKCVTIFVEK